MPEPKSSAYRWWQIFLPDRGGWFFCYLVFGMLFLRPKMLLWDGGSCRHIINGVMMLQNHRIPGENYTSWVFPHLECVTRSWLADFISGCFYQVGNLTGVVVICSIVIALGLTWSYQMGRARGWGLLSGLIMLVIVMGTVGMHWSARSHIYSYLPFLLLYYALFMAPAGPWRIVLSTVSMCFWTNAHGSYAIGMGMIGLKAVADLFDKGNAGAAGEFKCDAVALVAAFLASCVNPRGVFLYTAVLGYLTNPNVVHKTDEWRSFDLTAGVGSVCFLLLLVVVIVLLLKTRKVASWAELLLFIGLVVGGFESMRLIPYCALMAMPLTGPAWQALRQKTEQAVGDEEKPRGWLPKLVVMEKRAEPQEIGGLKIAVGCSVLTLLMALAAMVIPACAVTDFDEERLPVDAVNYMQQHKIVGHGFNYDNWGGYIYFKTHQLVFIDDWGDFLPAKFIDEYLQILLTRPGWEQSFKERGFEWILVPNESQLAQIMSASPQWNVACKNKTGVLLVKKSSAQ